MDVSRVSAQCQLGEPTQVWTLEKGKRRWALGGPASSRTRGLGPGHRARDTALDKRVPGSGKLWDAAWIFDYIKKCLLNKF